MYLENVFKKKRENKQIEKYNIKLLPPFSLHQNIFSYIAMHSSD